MAAAAGGTAPRTPGEVTLLPNGTWTCRFPSTLMPSRRPAEADHPGRGSSGATRSPSRSRPGSSCGSTPTWGSGSGTSSPGKGAGAEVEIRLPGRSAAGGPPRLAGGSGTVRQSRVRRGRRQGPRRGPGGGRRGRGNRGLRVRLRVPGPGVRLAGDGRHPGTDPGGAETPPERGRPAKGPAHPDLERGGRLPDLRGRRRSTRPSPVSAGTCRPAASASSPRPRSRPATSSSRSRKCADTEDLAVLTKVLRSSVVGYEHIYAGRFRTDL